jgi:hypothetical protein
MDEGRRSNSFRRIQGERKVEKFEELRAERQPENDDDDVGKGQNWGQLVSERRSNQKLLAQGITPSKNGISNTDRDRCTRRCRV